MIASLKLLFKNPYNRKHKLFAIVRFVQWKFIRLLKLKNIKYSLWGDKKLLLNFDSFQSMWVMYNYIVDWEEFNLISRLLTEADQVADIGANMGFYTIWMSKFIKTPGRIHAFEPDDKNFKALEQNVIANNIDSIVSLNKQGISDVVETALFSVGKDGENHILLHERPDAVSISLTTLDKYALDNRIASFRYIKVDVEGFEYSVLRGAPNLMREKNIDVIQIEINETLKNSGSTAKNILDLLNENAYQLCRYDVESNVLVPTGYDQERANYFAVYNLALINDQLS